MRGYDDLVKMGDSVNNLRGSDNIMWTVKFRNGMIKSLKLKIRKNEEGNEVNRGGFDDGDGEINGMDMFYEKE
jgi:adenylylsulfate reductase subunit B